ncbi:MAG: BMP family ABC transporter substrate-binding protein, partial [Oscillospiraceae bacterium]|nr:BMP family ABC transporter substrate-binding protein [Oscillospiraceae bacterium]
MKKFFALIMVLVLALSLAACGKKEEEVTPTPEPEPEAKFKVGFIFLHDENSTYDLNFINAAKAACEELGVDYVLRTNVPESEKCYETAAELADSGCSVVFADSFGHEDFMISAAKEFPNVW